jgi:hypothetical protein
MKPAFAIVRVDTFHPEDEQPEPRNSITVKRIVWDQATAEAEVARLNGLNGDKGCVYFWQQTRVDP